MLMLLMEAVCLVGRDVDGEGTRNGPVDLCRHGSVVLGRLVVDFQAEADWNWSPRQEDDLLRRKVSIYSTGEATVFQTRQPACRTEADHPGCGFDGGG